MAKQGKQMRVGACECFEHHSVKLVLLANGNTYVVDSNRFIFCCEVLYQFKLLPSSNFYFHFTHIRIMNLRIRQLVSDKVIRKCFGVNFVVQMEARSTSVRGRRAPCFLPTTNSTSVGMLESV
jgi:hypothetical protein